MEADVIVVGGGLSGLTAADCLKVNLNSNSENRVDLTDFFRVMIQV